MSMPEPVTRVVHLRCEYLVDPLGFDERAPRLSWRLETERRGARQCAYRVRVAATPEKLAEILRQAVRETFKDRQFHEQYKKVLGLYPTPLMPEEQQKLISDLPRDKEVIKVFKVITGMDPLPPRR